MLRVSLAVAFALSLGACATANHTPISPESLARLQGKSVQATQYAQPDFAAFTAGKAAFALVGAAMMISEGNEIVKENQIPDPAREISAGLQSRLSAGKGTKPLPNSKTSAQGADVAAIVATNSGSDYILDVRTMSWMFNYYPADWAHYRVTYSAKVRLIDAATKSVVAESACTTVQGDDKNPPSKDQLLDNKAALLKSYLSKAATTCTDLLAREVLKL